MHELSIAASILERVLQVAAEQGATRVTAVRLAIGRLSGIEPAALHTGFATLGAGTAAEGAPLLVRDVPLVVWCAHCLREVEVVSVQRLQCPRCGTACGEVRYGRELELEAVEVIG